MNAKEIFSPIFILVFVGAGMALVVSSALGFEHIGGYAPCALCLTQRNPYYIGIVIALLGGGAFWIWRAPVIIRITLALLFCALAITAGYGVYHAGVEWGFWPGPSACGAGLTGESDASDLLSSLSKSKAPSCDEAAGRFLGISFAGWNVIAATVLAIIAAYGVRGARGTRRA